MNQILGTVWCTVLWALTLWCLYSFLDYFSSRLCFQASRIWWGQIAWSEAEGTTKDERRARQQMLPARWGGQRRWRASVNYRLGELMAEMRPVRKCSRILYKRAPQAVQAAAATSYGAGSPVRRPRRRMLKARFPQGREWRVQLAPQQPWAVFQVQIATLMRKSVESFYVLAEGEEVLMNDIIPDHLEEVELRRRAPLRQPDEEDRVQEEGEAAAPPHRQENRRGSRSRSRPRRRGQAAEQQLRSYPRVIDEDTLYIEMSAGQGAFRLELDLYDLDYPESWNEVTVAEVEWGLLATYPNLFQRTSRIALACNYRCMRPTERIGEAIRDGSTFSLIPNSVLGGKRKRQEPQGPTIEAKGSYRSRRSIDDR